VRCLLYLTGEHARALLIRFRDRSIEYTLPAQRRGGSLSWQEVTTHVFEWANLYLQVPLGAAGFGFAFYQINQAKQQIQQAKTAAENARTAADAAKTAAEGARGQFKTMSLTVLLPQLRSLEELVERAIQDESRDLTMHLLQDWRWHASACREYLDGAVDAEAAVMAHIQKSLTAASSLKRKLLSSNNNETDWPRETKPFHKAMVDVTTNLGALSAQQTVKERT
jgi:hypothetical protein